MIMTTSLNSDPRALESTKALVIAAFLMFLSLVLFNPNTGFAFQAPSNTIYIPGIVRDFQRSHPDFDITPASGFGHYAGNIAETLGADRNPIFTGTGSAVNIEWRNSNNIPIAPNLFLGLSPIQITTAPSIGTNAVVDSWDPVTGLFGPAPGIITGATMPMITLPTGLGPSVGNYIAQSGPVLINSDLHCDKFTTQLNSIIQIDGDITIWCEASFNMLQTSSIELLSGSTLRLYIGMAFSMSQGSQLNINTLDPTRATIYVYSTFDLDISQVASLCATIVAPNSTLKLGQGVEFYGSYLGDTINLNQDSQLHSTGVQAFDVCATEIVDQAGLYSQAGTGGITSPATFNQWYSDMLGTNLSVSYQVPLVQNASGMYQFSGNSFYPIDNLLFGNEGNTHNYFFTYTFEASFTYTACSNQFFDLHGSDDIWLFINDQLVIDLGGVLPGTNQIIELDRLGLTNGEIYRLDFFYANRQVIQSEISLETNIVLTPPSMVVAGTGPYD